MVCRLCRRHKTVNGSESQRSPELQITIDTTAPAAIVSDPPSTVQVGQSYSFDADSPDEGTAGISYSLESEPSGMTIEPQSGQVTWTPTETQLAPQSPSIVVTDTAGNSATTNFDVTVLGVIPAQPDTYSAVEDENARCASRRGRACKRR